MSSRKYNRLILDVESLFGNEVGALLFDEATREDIFSQVNMIDGIKMEPLDSDQLTPELRRNARTNANAIDRNIKKLIRVFAK